MILYSLDVQPVPSDTFHHCMSYDASLSLVLLDEDLVMDQPLAVPEALASLKERGTTI
jgi:hypothetical protein